MMMRRTMIMMMTVMVLSNNAVNIGRRSLELRGCYIGPPNYISLLHDKQ